MIHPKIDIRTYYFEGYGGPSVWQALAIYENTLLEKRDHLSSEFAQGQAVAELKARWDREWSDEDWATELRGKPAASSLCDHCGGNTLDGSISVGEKTFCKQCESHVAVYQQELRDASARWDAEHEAKQKQRDIDRLAENEARTRGAFHWKDGWYFKRLPDGSVNVMFYDRRYIHPDLTIDADSWASIVASVSARGETADSWQAIREFHGLAASPRRPGAET